MNVDRYLIKKEYQDDQLEKLGDKYYVGTTIAEQPQKSYDSRQRIENPNFTTIPEAISRDKPIYTQEM